MEKRDANRADSVLYGFQRGLTLENAAAPSAERRGGEQVGEEEELERELFKTALAQLSGQEGKR